MAASYIRVLIRFRCESGHSWMQAVAVDLLPPAGVIDESGTLIFQCPTCARSVFEIGTKCDTPKDDWKIYQVSLSDGDER